MLLGLVGGAAYFGSLEIDPTKPIFVRPEIPYFQTLHLTLFYARVLTLCLCTEVLQ